MIAAEFVSTRMGYSVRRMDRSDLELAVGWAADEGWNPGVHDAEPFHRADPRGFFIGELDGRPIGSVSAVRYDDAFGFIGLYIVLADYRCGSFGPVLGKAAMDYLSDCNIGLDGVLAKQKNYRAFGFRPAYRNIRFEAAAALQSVTDAADIVDLADVPFERLAAYDRRFFPASRPAFLQAWITQPGTTALGLLDGDALKGVGVIRPCRVGYKIGPLFADGPDEAEIIYSAMTSRVAGQPVFLDVPEANTAALDLARRHHMHKVFETARMYSREQPDIDLNGVFGVTSFELG
jgi:hypothetical protein